MDARSTVAGVPTEWKACLMSVDDEAWGTVLQYITPAASISFAPATVPPASFPEFVCIINIEHDFPSA